MHSNTCILGISAGPEEATGSTLLKLYAIAMQVTQPADGRWQPEANRCTASVTYSSTTHSGVSYRPSTRPSTAHPSSPRAVPDSRQARPASARESRGRHSFASLAAGVRDKASVLAGVTVVAQTDNTHLQITKLLQSKGYRSVSPVSEGSTGATPSPAQTPCSVLSRPTTAGRGDSHMSMRLWIRQIHIVFVLLFGAM